MVEGIDYMREEHTLLVWDLAVLVSFWLRSRFIVALAPCRTLSVNSHVSRRL
jgi:hypothetical protein